MTEPRDDHATETVEPGVRVTASLASHLWSLPGSRERVYEEALFTSFNFAPAFFASRVLGPVRGAGASVTVIADATVFDAETRALAGAGTAYHLSLVAMRAAFHPKVSVVAGPDRALVAVGSGNLTSGGWFANEEILTVAYADRGGVPAIVPEIARWLYSLDDVSTGALAKEAARRVAELLEGLGARSPELPSPHRLVASTFGPIIDQLPAEPADELRLYAPFHDPRAAALAALIRRYSPTRISIAVQDQLTVFEPDVMVEIAADHGVELTWHRATDSGRRYRHGKLIEALGPAGTWTLTGSPNLTSAALLRSFGDGGNVEVGVVHVGAGSMYPGRGDALARTALVPAPPRSTDREADAANPASASVAVIEAMIDDEELHLTLSGAAPPGLSLEILRKRSEAAEEWVQLCPIHSGARELRVPGDVLPGDHVRVGWRSANGRGWTAALPVTGLRLVLHRVGSPSTGRRNASLTWRDLFDEASLGEWLRTALEIGRSQQAPSRPSTQRRAESRHLRRPETSRLTLDDDEAWAHYLEDAEARLGAEIVVLGTGRGHVPLPALPGAAGPEPSWARDEFDETDVAGAGHEESGTDEDEVDGDEPPAPPTFRRESAVVRRRFRDYLHRLVKVFSEYGPVERNAAARLVLAATWAGAWEEDDQWFELLADALEGVVAGVSDQVRPIASAIVAVGLYRLERAAAPDSRVGTGRRFAELSDRARPLVAELNESHLEEICSDLPAVWGVEPPLVRELIDAVCDPDEWSEPLREVVTSHPKWEVTRESEHIIAIAGEFRNPLRIAAEVLEQGSSCLQPVAIQVEPVRGAPLLAIRHGDVLAIRVMLGKRHAWKTYRLAGLVTPMVLVTSPDAEAVSRIDPAPWLYVSDTVRDACSAVGLDPISGRELR